MKTQNPQDCYLKSGDIIIVQFNNLALSAEGFKSSEVSLIPKSLSLDFGCLFQIDGQISFDEPFYLIHMLSGKYLCCDNRGAKLTSFKKKNSAILFRPIFKCQTAVSYQIRKSEQVIISPAQVRNKQENLSFLAVPFRQRNRTDCEILIKRNQATHFTINNINLNKKQGPIKYLTTLSVYQLNHLETDRQMSFLPTSRNNNSSHSIQFQKSSNQHDSYLQIIHKDSFGEQIFLRQKIINYEDQLYFKSMEYNKFLSIDYMGEINLVSEPNENCIFLIEPYSEGQLNLQSLIKVKHKISKKYLSTSPNHIIEEFKLVNVYKLKIMQQKNLRKTLFINELTNNLKELFKKNILLYDNKLKIKQVLLLLIKYIYGRLNIECFLNMQSETVMMNNEGDDEKNQGINKNIIIITEEEQDLLGSVGILEIMKSIVEKFLPLRINPSENNKNQHVDEHIILLYTMMITTGVCYQHTHNTHLFIQEIKIYYEAVGRVQGAIQCLYHIFKNKKQLLSILQATQHKLTNVSVIHSIDMFLSIIVRHSHSLQNRTKILKLLNAFTITRLQSGNQNIPMHQVSILQCIEDRSLDSILLPIKKHEEKDLVTLINNNEEQLQQIMMWKSKYQKQINVLEVQLQLYASVCYSQEGANVNYIRTFLSQEVIERYLRSNLPPNFREIFMRILIQIYLTPKYILKNVIFVHNEVEKNKKKKQQIEDYSSLTNKLIGQQIEMIETKYNQNEELSAQQKSVALENIQNLVLEVTRKSIKSSTIDQSFYMNIQALTKFLQMNILDQKQVVQFREILIEFISMYSKQIFLEDEKRSLVVEILKIFAYYEQIYRKIESNNLIQHFKKLSQPSSQNIFNLYNSFANQSTFLNFNEESLINILEMLIKQSLHYEDKEIFYYSSKLLKLITKREFMMLDSLKEKIIIGSDWSINVYNRVTKLFAQLNQAFEQHKIQMHKSSKNIVSHQQKINQEIQQLNYLFYQWPKSSQKNGISPFLQNIYREIKIHEVLIKFMIENYRRVHEVTIKNIFTTSFDFLLLLIDKNQDNILILKSLFQKSKILFTVRDCGQAKLINKVLQSMQHRSVFLDSLYDVCMICLQNSGNSQPNSYIILSLTKIFQWNHKIDKQRIQRFVVSLSDPKLMMALLNVTNRKNYEDRYEFRFSTNALNKQNYNKSFPVYLLELGKFLHLLIEQSSQRNLIIERIKKYISIQVILNQLNSKDLLENTSMEELILTLMKRELIKLFIRVHLDMLKDVTQQIQPILGMIQKMQQRMMYANQDIVNAQDHLLQQIEGGRMNDEGKIMVESYLSTESSFKKFRSIFKHIYINVTILYPFIARLLNTLLLCNGYIDQHQHLKKEIEVLLDVLFRKFKENIQTKLTYSEYAQNHKQYHLAIQICEEMFRRKVGLNFVYEGTQDEDQQGISKQAAESVFIPSKMSNLAGNYTTASNELQLLLYQCIISLCFDKKVNQRLKKIDKKRPFKLTQQDFNYVSHMISNILDSAMWQISNLIEILDIFITQELSIGSNSFVTKMCNIIGEQSQDLTSKNLCKYLAISNKILGLSLQKTIEYEQIGYKPAKVIRISDDYQGQLTSHLQYPQKFIKRILNVIQCQKQLYQSYSSLKHLQHTMQNTSLSYQTTQQFINVEICLEWIRNKLINIMPKDKDKFFNLIAAVVELLKVYGQFIVDFKSKYISNIFLRKVQLCWGVLFHAITGVNTKNMLHMVQRQLWTEVNIILALADDFNKNNQQMQMNTQDMLRRLLSVSLRDKNRFYVQQVNLMYKNTVKFYQRVYNEETFPLLPGKSYYANIKKWAIACVKEFKLLPIRTANLFTARISMPLIDRNIVQTYQKHQQLYNTFDIGSVCTQMVYPQGSQHYQIALNMCIQNAVDLYSLKMFIEAAEGNTTLQTAYKNSRIEIINSNKIQSTVSSITSFISDFVMLFVSFFLNLCRKNKKTTKNHNLGQAMKFFSSKIGRVDILSNNEVFLCEFMIRPQCKVNKQLHKKLIAKVNFISVQLKLESIMKETMVFLLYFKNEMNFYRRFYKINIMYFLVKHFAILKYISFIIIIFQNIYLLVKDYSNQSKFAQQLNFTEPFNILQLVNMAISSTILFAYFIKDVPFLVARVNLQLLKRSESYGSNYRNYSPFLKFLIKYSKIVFDSTMIYHILYTTGVFLILYSKLLVALVLLDIFFQIPTLVNLLYAIWKPKIELLLTFVSFGILQYFFSIFMFFAFRAQTSPYCQNLGSCFGFIFITTYKAVGGFVGYLFFIRNTTGTTLDVDVTFFEIFQDIYVILVFQIFFALILSIIIDNFTQIRTEQAARKQYLDSCCIICNLDRSIFNSSLKTNFKGHIAINHSIWNYFYYFQYFVRKQPLMRTYLQKKIYENRGIQWLPNGYAKFIKQP